eukprot:maker-scaffold_5-snap-gene-2.38-mRNA-1 protein AED:0.04 eAED:0.04 QI:461/1/0.8/1/0.75/0.6/5/102/317
MPYLLVRLHLKHGYAKTRKFLTFLVRNCSFSRLAICLQEIVSLKNPLNVVFAKSKKSKNAAHEWSAHIIRTLNENYQGYGHVFEEKSVLYQVGLCLIIVVNKEISRRIFNIREFSSSGSHWFGNKGGLSALFDFRLRGEGSDTKSFCFVGVHLTAHPGTDKKKNKDLSMILNSTHSPLKEDAVFVFGDLNYRIEGNNINFDDVNSYIHRDRSTTNFDEMLKVNDRLTLQMERDEIKTLRDFKEGRIVFPPTYKFLPGTRDYNPNRIPSWCDRVVYKVNDDEINVDQKSYYSSEEYLESDHKPVAAFFTFPSILLLSE